MRGIVSPQNILINKAQLKTCDFGLSRQYSGSASGLYIPGVVTLWYRAPELLLGTKAYSSAIDMWSVGCIMAELVLNQVFFCGKSDIHKIGCIYQILGAAGNMLRLKVAAAASFFSGAPMLSASGFDLLQKLLAFDPDKRITTKAALNHNCFKEYYRLSSS